MQAKVLFALIAFTVASFANGAVVDTRAALEVFDPPILTPNAQTVWVVGETETVTWCVDLDILSGISLSS